MNNIKRKEFVDELDVDLNNFEIEVKNCENLAVRTADKHYNLQQRFITACKCDKIAKKAF